MLEDEYEDGEILEEGEEVEDVTRVESVEEDVEMTTAPTEAPVEARGDHAKAVLQTPSIAASSEQARTHEPLLPTPPSRTVRSDASSSDPSGYYEQNASRKRLHSEMQRPLYPSSMPGRNPYPPRRDYRSNDRDRGAPANNSSSNRERHDDREEKYSEDLIVKYPRQVPGSHVLLNFAKWMELAGSRYRRRLDAAEVQEMLVNVLDRRPHVSSYLMSPELFPNKPAPTKVCVVLLGNLHPSVVQRYRNELQFFNGCSSLPCVLTKPDQTRRMETPLPELLYRFPKPSVDIKDMPVNELFYGHELTFLMCHSIGYNDELILQPTGKFARKTQPQGGTWHLDGDLLHLKWRQQHKGAADESANASNPAEEEDDSYILDVLVAEDGTMHKFSTDPETDKTYARDTPEHMNAKRRNTQARSLRLSLIKAVQADVPRAPDGSIIRTTEKTVNGHIAENPESIITNDPSDLKQEDFEYYVLSPEELRQHGYPVDVGIEQTVLQTESKGCSRDQFVQTRPRTLEDSADAKASVPNVYALDCEMCETDLGMELTRITVVDVQGTVVYDQMVKPQSTIINYHTEFSGITAESLQSTRHILADVQRELLSQFLFEDTVLVGHSLTSDLRALRIVHLKIADTAILYPHQRGFPFKTSLKFLTKTFLGKDIQTKIQEGHDSAEDAVAAMELLIQKVKRGPTYGIPETTQLSGAYSTLVDKVAARNQRITILKYSPPDEKATGSDSSSSSEPKPWHLYASGDLHSHLQSPFEHASALARSHQDSTSNSSTHALSSTTRIADAKGLTDSVRAALTEHGDSVCWVEVEQSSGHEVANEFLLRHSQWMEKQSLYCKEIDGLLCQIRDDVLDEQTLLMVIPQGDLSMLRYLKGLRTRSKWKDGPHTDTWTDEMQAAVTDAVRGTMDSCVFLTQK
ncbi:hypothetical protein Poli38472_011537 [Pythium oligandrum]|uniref:Exonuclease domain-containing protein n=1 Tax=Pythium oligandrum TaxID=41045 RepID=A0A8K1CJL1_PYTOL|nr:hypothetical protein Poli38472_011537 [Pythium oligandrum]|eukprot:TMW64657.1 hypothetical protein Poli38472_011537 [Pythium oligandrum]